MAGSMVGRTFNNRYKLTERVGIGGMAEVYRAEDSTLGRVVAVKVMLPQYAADPTFTQRFRQEAASAAKLQSPYIVNIYDWGLDGETYYIVMEYLRGTDLKTAIRERGMINQRKAAEIGSQVAQALSVAHEGGIIHRDIKPQNIMIQPDGNIKVMDFGIARAGDAGLSQTATVLGTAHYVSPEQAQGKDLTGASDMYSLGIVLYEATTGHLPFDGQDAVSVAVKQVNEAPQPPSFYNPDIDPALEAIIMKAMAKDPQARFANAAEMRKVLNDYLAGRPVDLGYDVANARTQAMAGTVPPIGGGTSVMNPVGRNAADATMVAGGFHAPNTEELEQQQKKKKRNTIIGVLVAIVALVVIGLSAFALMGNGDNAEVPDVTNQTIDQARQNIQAAGFKIGTETEVYSSDVAVGHVVSTNPGAHTKAKKGSSVNISVSKGTEQVSVPDLKGMTRDEAKRALDSVGLNLKEGDAVFSDDVETDKVASQDISGGTKANKGDTVTIHLSKGAEMIDIPNVVGATADSAESSLTKAGFKVSRNYVNSSEVDEGRVVSQSETGQAKKGATIKINISNGPASIELSSVVGKTQSEAIAYLSSKGITNYAVTTNPSTTVTAGNVISVSPSSVKEGSSTQVTLVVSSGPGGNQSTDS